jgi:hypothetical protein
MSVKHEGLPAPQPKPARTTTQPRARKGRLPTRGSPAEPQHKDDRARRHKDARRTAAEDFGAPG